MVLYFGNECAIRGRSLTQLPPEVFALPGPSGTLSARRRRHPASRIRVACVRRRHSTRTQTPTQAVFSRVKPLPPARPHVFVMQVKQRKALAVDEPLPLASLPEAEGQLHLQLPSLFGALLEKMRKRLLAAVALGATYSYRSSWAIFNSTRVENILNIQERFFASMENPNSYTHSYSTQLPRSTTATPTRPTRPESDPVQCPHSTPVKQRKALAVKEPRQQQLEVRELFGLQWRGEERRGEERRAEQS